MLTFRVTFYVVLDKIQNNRALNRFCHDLAHILTLFVLHPDTAHHNNKLLPGMRDLQK